MFIPSQAWQGGDRHWMRFTAYRSSYLGLVILTKLTCYLVLATITL